MKKLTSHLLEPRAIILGFTVFYFSSTSLMWLDEPFSQYHQNMFAATVLLISALSLVINKWWSILLAGITSGQFPFVIFAAFWMLSRNAELTPFSFEHIQTWWWEISHVGLAPVLWLTVSSVILSLSITAPGPTWRGSWPSG